MIGNLKGETHERKRRTDAPQSSQKGDHFRSVGGMCGFLAVAALMPNARARILNVEDSEELIEQRPDCEVS